MDIRERFADYEESLRVAVAGVLKHVWGGGVVSIVSQDSDGKTLQAQPAIKRRDTDQNGNVTYTDHPLLLDVPLHFVGGGGVTLTHAVKTGDEILSVIAARPPDSWFQSGGTQPPAVTRTHSLSDAIALPGLRSTPRELKQISTASAQLRSDDKLHVVDHHPQNGTTVQSADPSTPAASDSFDPFTQATKFIQHLVKGAQGVIGSAVDGGTTHTHGVTHTDGAWMSAMGAGGTNLVRAHPVLGSLLSALDGKHTVTASPTGVSLASTMAISLSCPPGMLSLPAGGVGGEALASGAAAQNVGALGGDLSGELPNPQVVSIAHLVGMNTLPRAANDAAAAALTPPVSVGSPYLNTSVASGAALLAIRIA